MYFTKVELHNFGIYKGTHEMSLTDQIGNRNITLVGGLNGRGKTTFHDSILIALYGKQALKYIQEKARSYDKLLLDHINKHATDDETYVADTPGFSSFDTDQMDIILKENLQYAFPDLAAFAGGCQFHDCSHRAEPGCSVRAALEEGMLEKTRYESYLKLYEKACQIKPWELK